MEMIACAFCERYIKYNECLAFNSSGSKIPADILTGKSDHTHEVEGDGGLTFAPINRKVAKWSGVKRDKGKRQSAP